MASDYYRSGYEIKPMLIRLFVSPQFSDPSNYFKRYSWPAEFVVRSIKEMGWSGFSVNDALNPLINMGQQLFEPPDVAGWDLGPGLVLERRDAGADELRGAARDQPEVRAARRRARHRCSRPRALVSWALDRLPTPPFAGDSYNALRRLRARRRRLDRLRRAAGHQGVRPRRT